MSKETAGPKSKRTTNRRSKDSVFVGLFSDKSYVFQLYKDLHPEDKEARKRDVVIKTLRSTFVNSLYNDLGFTVDDKLVLLLEAQSVWDVNIPMRMLFYLSETYKDYLDKKGLQLHSRKRFELPKPELYVVCTGKKVVPDVVSFKETYFGGLGSLDLEIKVLKGVDVATIYGQYIGMCDVYDEQRKKYGDSLKCAKETIRICIKKGFLVSYLKAHKEEVITMLDKLFNEEEIRKAQIQEEKRKRQECLKRGIRKGRKEGLEEGLEKGREEGQAFVINKLIQAGISPDFLSQALNLEGGLPSAK